MKLTFEGSSGWIGEAIYSPPNQLADGALPSIILWVRADTEEQAGLALDYLVNLFAAGRECIFRARPEVSRDRNFDTGEQWWQGFMRFSFVPGQDKWSDSPPMTSIPMSKLGVE